jgi:hypothetical protein
VAEMTDEARVVALDRLRPGDIADRSGELLDVVFGWADFARLRRQVAAQCAASGLRCLVANTIPKATVSCPAPRSGDIREATAAMAEPGEPIGADSGRGPWLAATLADELTRGP